MIADNTEFVPVGQAQVFFAPFDKQKRRVQLGHDIVVVDLEVWVTLTKYAGDFRFDLHVLREVRVEVMVLDATGLVVRRQALLCAFANPALSVSQFLVERAYLPARSGG